MYLRASDPDLLRSGRGPGTVFGGGRTTDFPPRTAVWQGRSSASELPTAAVVRYNPAGFGAVPDKEERMSSWKKLEARWVERDDPAVTVYHLSGTLTGSSESYAFLDELRKRVRKGHTRVVLNLEAVEAMTSEGVGILAAGYTSVMNATGRMCLAQVPERSRVLLGVVGLLAVIGECATEEEAVRRVGA